MFRLWLGVIFLFVLLSAVSPTAAAEECSSKRMSNDFSWEIRGLQYRVRGGHDLEKTKNDVAKLRRRANCYEDQILDAILIEADAFSRDPNIALPALFNLYQNTSKQDRRFALILRALGKNFAVQGRANDIAGLMELHPDAPEDVAEYWRTNLALVHAQNGDIDSAVSVIDAFMAVETPSPTEFQVAIAVNELANDADKVDGFSTAADAIYGKLRWPEPLPGMSSQRFETLYRRRFDPALSDARPTWPPRPTYPRQASEDGIEGECMVWFDVSKDGEPFNIEAECSSYLFKAEAERAVSKVKFEPLVYQGVPYVRTSLVYPLTFRLN